MTQTSAPELTLTFSWSSPTPLARDPLLLPSLDGRTGAPIILPVGAGPTRGNTATLRVWLAMVLFLPFPLIPRTSMIVPTIPVVKVALPFLHLLICLLLLLLLFLVLVPASVATTSVTNGTFLAHVTVIIMLHKGGLVSVKLVEIIPECRLHREARCPPEELLELSLSH